MTQTAKAERYQRAFESERAAFEGLQERLRDEYDKQFVAVHQGQVVDSDPDMQKLVSRFFATYGEASVYIGYVGEPQPVFRIPSPSVRH